MAAEDYFDVFDWADNDSYDGYEDHLLRGHRNFARNMKTLTNLLTKERKSEMLNQKMIQKYYVGAEHIAQGIANGHNDKWTRKTEADAIAHAKRILQDDPHKDCVIVVKITHIIRRKDQPIVVEKVK